MRWMVGLITLFSTAVYADSPRDLFWLIQQRIQEENAKAGKDTGPQSFQGSAAQSLEEAQKQEQKTQENIEKQERQDSIELQRELHPQNSQEELEDQEEAAGDNLRPDVNVENDNTENRQVQSPVDPDLSKDSPLNRDLSQ